MEYIESPISTQQTNFIMKAAYIPYAQENKSHIVHANDLKRSHCI